MVKIKEKSLKQDMPTELIDYIKNCKCFYYKFFGKNMFNNANYALSN